MKTKKAHARARARREVTLTVKQAEEFINSLAESAKAAWDEEDSEYIVRDVMDFFEKLYGTPIGSIAGSRRLYWADRKPKRVNVRG